MPTQVKARPPSFVAFVSGGKELSEASRRFLTNLVRRQFGFGGVPMRLTVRYNKRSSSGGSGSGGRRRQRR